LSIILSNIELNNLFDVKRIFQEKKKNNFFIINSFDWSVNDMKSLIENYFFFVSMELYIFIKNFIKTSFYKEILVKFFYNSIFFIKYDLRYLNYFFFDLKEGMYNKSESKVYCMDSYYWWRNITSNNFFGCKVVFFFFNKKMLSFPWLGRFESRVDIIYDSYCG